MVSDSYRRRVYEEIAAAASRAAIASLDCPTSSSLFERLFNDMARSGRNMSGRASANVGIPSNRGDFHYEEM